jgi:hypothetical protein
LEFGVWSFSGIWCLLLGGLVPLICALDPATSSAQQTNTSAALDYASFKVISEKNIFNPRRRGYYIRNTPQREERRDVRAEWFALVGTLSSDKGPVAFFDGSSSRYSQALKPSEDIAGYTVADVQPSYVRLISASNHFELSIGKELRRENEGEWRLGERTELASVAPIRGPEATPAPVPDGASAEMGSEADMVFSDNPPDDSGTNAAPATSSSTVADPVLRRLMERRAQEEAR